MANLKQILSDALALADFSNLEPAGVDRFRRKYPAFAPDGWWDHRAGEQWRMTQRFLRESWEDHFEGGIFFTARLVLSVFNPLFNPEDLLKFNDFPAVLIAEPDREKAFAELSDIPWGETPFQRAALFLFNHPWRARFCAVCKKRFVAAEPKNKFCSQECSHEARRKSHNDWARKNLKDWRRKQKARR